RSRSRSPPARAACAFASPAKRATTGGGSTRRRATRGAISAPARPRARAARSSSASASRASAWCRAKSSSWRFASCAARWRSPATRKTARSRSPSPTLLSKRRIGRLDRLRIQRAPRVVGVDALRRHVEVLLERLVRARVAGVGAQPPQVVERVGEARIALDRRLHRLARLDGALQVLVDEREIVERARRERIEIGRGLERALRRPKNSLLPLRAPEHHQRLGLEPARRRRAAQPIERLRRQHL